MGSHSLPIFKSEYLNFLYGQWFFRFCVPFFFMVTGYFIGNKNIDKQKEYIKHIFYLYLLSMFIYFPLIIKSSNNTKDFLFVLIHGYSHLWYLISSIYGLILLMIFNKYLSEKIVFYIASGLLLFGIFFDEYYKLFNIPFLVVIKDFLNYFGGARNGVLFAFPMLFFGMMIRRYKISLSLKKTLLLLFLLSLLAFLEANLIYIFIGVSATFDISFFGWMTAVALMEISINSKLQISHSISLLLRKTSVIIYIIHPLFITILKFFDVSYFCLFSITWLLSLIFSLLVIALFNKVFVANKL